MQDSCKIIARFLQDLAKCKKNDPFLARMHKFCKDTLVRFFTGLGAYASTMLQKDSNTPVCLNSTSDLHGDIN